MNISGNYEIVGLPEGESEESNDQGAHRPDMPATGHARIGQWLGGFGLVHEGSGSHSESGRHLAKIASKRLGRFALHLTTPSRIHSLAWLEHNIFLGAFDDRDQLVLLGLRDVEL